MRRKYNILPYLVQSDESLGRISIHAKKGNPTNFGVSYRAWVQY